MRRNAIEDVAQIRLSILEMVYNAQEGHIPSAFSVVETMYGIYSILKKDDAFFLSKGHASAAYYAILAHFGHIPKEILTTFCKYNSKLGGHPHRLPPAIMNSSGSLGHGFPIAAGFAFSKKIKRESGRVFCVIGDGEANEGTVWETAMYGEQLKLSNLTCVVDNNNSQVRAMVSTNLPGKFAAFGWNVREIDGHNLGEMERALTEPLSKNKPLCIVAYTVKGKGLKVLEENYQAWHHKSPTEAEFVSFKEELLDIHAQPVR